MTRPPRRPPLSPSTPFLRSNKGVGPRLRSGAQPPIGSTWYLGSVSEPRPPVSCFPRVRPFPPQPPPEVVFLCSIASTVLWPHPTSHPRTCSAYGICLPEPARHESGHG